MSLFSEAPCSSAWRSPERKKSPLIWTFPTKTLIHMCIPEARKRGGNAECDRSRQAQVRKIRKKVYRRGEKSVGNRLLPSENEERNVLKFLAF